MNWKSSSQPNSLDGRSLPQIVSGWRPFEVALKFAEAGLRIFPVSPATKEPCITGWRRLASADPATIREWWRRWPDAMVGLPTGTANGIWALDLDVRDRIDGVGAFKRMCASHGAEPVTALQLTPSGGRHLFFAMPAEEIRNSAGRVGKGMDVRGEGGYVVAPGSVRSDGKRYELRRREIAPAPGWLVAKTFRQETPIWRPQPRSAPGASDQYGQAALRSEVEAVREAPEGVRNDTLNKASFCLGQLVASGHLSLVAARESLTAAGRECGLPLPEVAKTVQSGLNAGLRSPRRLRAGGAHG